MSVFSSRLSTALAGLGGYVLFGGLAGLVGWAADLRRLTDWIDNGISIQPNSAVVCIAAGVALLALLSGAPRLARAGGAVVVLIAGATGLQYVLGTSFGIDQLLLFGRSWGARAAFVPGRMGPPGVVSWTLLGAALLLATSASRRARAWAPWLALPPALVATLSIVGYLYGVRKLYTVPTATTIALQTATFVVATSIGVLVATSDLRPARLLRADGIAGGVIRRALPILLVVPVLLGMLRLAGERAGLYDSSFGAALRTVTEIVLFLGLLCWLTAVVARQERRQHATDRARADADRKLRATLENVADGFVMFDVEWRFTHVNQEAERRLGRPAARLLGRELWREFPRLRDSVAGRELQRAAEQRVAVQFEDFDETLGRWFARRAAPTADGGLAVSFQDVTARKEAEAVLRDSRAQLERELADAKLLQRVSVEILRQDAPSGLHEKLLDAAIELMRADFASLQAFRPEHGSSGALELLAARGFDARANEHWRWVGLDSATSCGRALAARQRVTVEDVRRSEPQPSAADLAVFAQLGIRATQTTPLVSRSGALVGMLSTQWRQPHLPSERSVRLLDILARQAADLLERMRYEAEREAVLAREKAARAEAEHVGRMKDEFLATLSHELRTPLNAILGWTHVLRQDIANPQKAEVALDVLERNGKLQARLIADMLDMSRIVSGKVRLDVQRVDFGDIVGAAVASVRPAAASKGVDLESTIELDATAIDGDAARLQQIVWNLLSNAVKFTPRGGRVRVRLARAEGHVELAVADTGEGISAEFLPRIFERFSQADGSPSRVHGGLGIGLALVKELTELHGGRVRVASQGVERGATFSVELPLPADAPASTPAPAPPESAGEPIALTGVAVLLVDDQADGAVVARRLLEERGAEVLVALSGAEALGLLQETRVDVIVSDVGMPAMDGYQFIAEVRRRGIQAPALALTAFARPVDRTRALLSGYQAHLSKPVAPREFVAAVAALVRSAPPPASRATVRP